MNGSESNSSSDENIIGEFRYGDANERRNQGVSIETIRDWFPESTIQGKLPKSVLNAIWERYPEPAESVLKTSAIDVDMAGDLPKFALSNDSETRNTFRNFSCAFRPIVSVALAVQEDASIPEASRKLILEGLREAILLHNHAAAIAETDRRRAIGRAIRWPDNLLSRCNTTASGSRATLFGEKFVAEHKQWKQEQLAERTLAAQKDAINYLARSMASVKTPTERPPKPQFAKNKGTGERQKPQPHTPKRTKGESVATAAPANPQLPVGGRLNQFHQMWPQSDKWVKSMIREGLKLPFAKNAPSLKRTTIDSGESIAVMECSARISGKGGTGGDQDGRPYSPVVHSGARGETTPNSGLSTVESVSSPQNTSKWRT